MASISKAAAARIGGILAGAGVLFVGGVLVASSPALADNGVHISNIGTTSIAGGPDGCAGCHRIHSAKSDDGMLLVNSSEEALCATCHEAGTGATTDVENGIQYQSFNPAVPTSPVLALRGGGFTNALIGSGAATRAYTSTGSIDTTQSLVPVGASQGVTSAHTVGSASTMWGAGAINSTAGGSTGTSVTLECASCHDPHGNGNFRILRPAGSLGSQTIKMGVALTGATSAPDAINGTGKYIWTLTFAANPGFVPGQAVAIQGSSFAFAPSLSLTSTRASWTQANISAVSASAPWTITIPNMSTNPTYDTGGLVSTASANTIESASWAGGVASYTTFVNHGLSTGQKVSITGSSVAGFNVIMQPITVTSADTFTVAVADPGAAYVKGAFISGIPDSKPVTGAPGAGYMKTGVNEKVYNTQNYWRADDHFYTVAFSATGVQFPTPANNAGPNTTNGESAFIVNASQWCTTCHTRYMATNSTSRKFTSGDTVFTFKHTSGAYKENSPDCMQCHVAHGSNAAMTGDFTANLPEPAVSYQPLVPAEYDAVNNPTGTKLSDDSRLLRVDNRGTCIFCHNF
jgi:predicted CXXCH cytochrome family protein